VRRRRCRRSPVSRAVACAGVESGCCCGPREVWRQEGARRVSPARRGGPCQRYALPSVTRLPATTPPPSSFTTVSRGPAVWTPLPSTRSSRASSAAAPGAQPSGTGSHVPAPPRHATCEVYFRSPPGTIGPCVSRKSVYLCGDTACT